ncbi:hypothetical protein [Mycobacterium vicinigordonae]|uniref:Helix-turn-helix domain-containing protein n=1 Tax=Mycobacterium vicinigordonae TaxID=1719132 RepID=A0A7D6E0D1_9MYCO|nr:hypothetical protein [Mycobacterium vicinigordonae]QLL08848.1 hypothetical protein H0P51_08065 [Mycobacterium vicinigordonae]
MAPTMSRQDSRARTEEAWRLRATGRTWSEIAAELGYGSPSAAYMAVTRLTKRTPAAAPEAVRRSASEGLRIMRAVLYEQFADAKVRNDNDDLTLLAKELRNNIVEDAKLHGAHSPVKVQTEVHVSQSAVAILDRAESELLALAQRQPRKSASNIIEAEVVPAP